VALLGPGWLLAASLASAQAGVGVASFERVAAEGQGVPDVAGRLAQRLGTKGVAKVVGPAELGAPAMAEPAAEDAARWASEAGVGFVVVGRTTRLGNTLSVDARLLDGSTGLPIGARFVEEASRPEDLGQAIEGLADQVLARVAERGPTAAAAPAAAAPAREKGGRFDKDSPISIKSDELEATERGGRRKFIFTGNVRAVQDDLVVNSDRLEAFYPPGASNPDRLVATGHVVLVQTGRTARCREATYYRSEEKLVCVGQAELEQECDRVRGDTITFFLDTEVLQVTGSADVNLRPDDPKCATSTAAREGS
jgi:lipopolysaccharide transport protein LptA